MQERSEEFDVGVIVGRFQAHELTEAHVDLIQAVCDAHDKVIVILGLSPLMVTSRNPLDFESRKQMILESFPNVTVAYIKDVVDDVIWSRKLDEIVGDLVSPTQTVVLYGGRDSFVPHYKGKHKTRTLESSVWVSATEVRKRLRRSVSNSPDFRHGVVWASMNRFPTTYTTVDVAVFNDDETKILLARKANETKFRLIGGFADPASETFEADARREVAEEAHIEITDPVYVGSQKIDDWRYRGEVDKIKTLLFRAKRQYGRPTPDDDIIELRWFDFDKVQVNDLVPEHVHLFMMLKPPHWKRVIDGTTGDTTGIALVNSTSSISSINIQNT
jgi:bifunctional NMN adenylyltransferase/nudix hydrolase